MQHGYQTQTGWNATCSASPGPAGASTDPAFGGGMKGVSVSLIRLVELATCHSSSVWTHLTLVIQAVESDKFDPLLKGTEVPFSH